MRFAVLGTLQVMREGERVEPGAFKQRSLLALLLIHRNRVVSTDRVIDELWGDDASSDRHGALWVHVSNLRTMLEPDRPKGSSGTVLITRSPGYLLEVADNQIDSGEFEQLLAEGRALLHSDPAAASLVLSEALQLWRGKAYEDFTYESFAQTEIARLAELRTETVEARIEADLERGLGPELVGELEALTREHPLRERLVGQLMRALHRSGRRAESLRAFAALKRRLGEELGIEPSSQLADLEESLLTGAAEFSEPREGRPTSGTGLAVRAYELREQIGSGGSGLVYQAFQAAVGREVAIKLIRPELANDAGFIRRFEADTKVVAGLEHPHIVPIHDYWREPGGAYLVMPLMRGGSLAGVTLSEDEAIEVLAQVASALAAAHGHGIFHGDLKPTNVLLDEEGNAFLADFGIADATSGPEMDLRGLGRLLRETLVSTESPGPGGAALLEVADRALAVGAAGGYADVESFLIDLGRASGRPSLAAAGFPDNPYKGLRPFQEGDAGLFFGRERVVERLVNRLGTSGGGRFVVVVGPSGSGKSSVVKAGLLPAVRQGAVHGSEGWFVAEMIPGAHPFRELERALQRMAVDPPPTLLEQLEAGPGGLRRVVDAILPGDEDSKLLLIVDQLEELFIQTRDEDLTRRFLAGLTEAVSATSARLRVVATLRADFYDRPLRYQGFADLLRAGTEVITPMSAEEVERAVGGPTEAVGVGLEPGLAAAVVADVADEPSALPLMQYAMTEVFERRQGTTLTVASYREIGGVTGALGRRAEELYQGLDSSGREIARQVFLQLISLGEREEDTRRRVRRSELAGLGETPEEVDRVVETYGRHRLLTFDRDPVSRGPTVEVAHEALLSEWPRCKGWVEEAREEIRIQRRLNTAADEWQLNAEDPGYLLAGPRLQEAQAWLASTDLAVAPALRSYIIKSAENADAEMRTGRRRRRLAISVIGVVAATALTLLVFGLTQRSAADRLAAVENINRLVESAEDVLPRDPELSLLLGAEAVEETQALGLEVFPKNLEVLHEALRAHRLLFTVDDATSAIFTPHGDRVYVGHPGGMISVRDATTGEEVDRIATPSSSVRDKLGAPPMPLAISRDGRWLTTGYAVIDTNEMTSIRMSWPEDRLALVDVDISDDGSLLALAHFETGSREGSVTLWHREQQKELWSMRLQAPLGVDFDPEGRRLAVSNNTTDLDSNWTHIFDVETGDQVEVIPMEDPVAVRFHPDDDRRLAINDAPGIIRFWDLESRGFIPRVETGHSVTIQDLDFGGGGSLLASGDISGVVIVRDGETGNQLYTLPHHGGPVVTVDLSADGSRLATVTERQIDQPGPLRVFDTAREGGQDLTTVYLGGFPATVDVHPSGDSIAVGSHVDGRRQILTMTGQPLMVLPHHQPFSQVVGVAGPIAFSPDGETLATGDARGNVSLWDAESGAELTSRNVREMVPDLGETLGSASGLGEAVFVVEFSPDGERLGIGGAGFILMADGENLDNPVLLHVSDLTFTESLSFSPDGQRLIAGRAKGVPDTQTQVIPAIIEWDVSTGEQVNSRSMAGKVMAADYSPLGDLVAYGTSDAVVVDADSFEIRRKMTFDSRDIWDVAFSPDGTQLAVAYGDGSVVIWDPHTGLALYELAAHDAFAADVEWTPDGTRLVSVGSDETLRTYAIDPDVLIDEAGNRVNRELTAEECRRYLSRERC